MKEVYGNKVWYNENLQIHRNDGPAIEYYNGDKTWYKNGELHREDGPAIECANGHKEWYIYNIPINYSVYIFYNYIIHVKG